MRLIDADALKTPIEDRIDNIPASEYDEGWNNAIYAVIDEIDNAPTVEPFERIGAICNENCGYKPQGEYVDISKLRLMTVEECAGHTIDYAMGWKACIEWIKKGGQNEETDK